MSCVLFMSKKMVSFFGILVVTFISITGCSNSSETEQTVYLLEKYTPGVKEKKRSTITALEPRKFTIWKNAKTVYQEAPFVLWKKIGVINKDCLVEDKNNWCCYGPKKDHVDLYQYNLPIPKLIADYDWITDEDEKTHGLACYYGMNNGKWMIQEKYHDQDNSFRGISLQRTHRRPVPALLVLAPVGILEQH